MEQKKGMGDSKWRWEVADEFREVGGDIQAA